MTQKTYRVGIVGLSGIAAGSPGSDAGPLRDEIMVGHTACLAQTPGVDVVGVCDLSSEMLDKFADTWGDRWPNATPYTDYREMVGREGLDILTVANRRRQARGHLRLRREQRRQGPVRREAARHHDGGRQPHDRRVRGQRRRVERRPHAAVAPAVPQGALGHPGRRHRPAPQHRRHTRRSTRDDVPQRHPRHRRHLLLRRLRAGPGIRKAGGGIRPLGPVQGRRRQAAGE